MCCGFFGCVWVSLHALDLFDAQVDNVVVVIGVVRVLLLLICSIPPSLVFISCRLANTY